MSLLASQEDACKGERAISQSAGAMSGNLYFHAFAGPNGHDLPSRTTASFRINLLETETARACRFVLGMATPQPHPDMRT